MSEKTKKKEPKTMGQDTSELGDEQLDHSGGSVPSFSYVVYSEAGTPIAAEQSRTDDEASKETDR